LVANYEEILEPSAEKALYFSANLVLPPWLINKLPWRLNQLLKATTQNLRGICHQLIQDKKQLIAADKERHVDILTLLIKSNNFADEMLVDQLLTFLAAG
jgi:cytochrome P450